MAAVDRPKGAAVSGRSRGVTVRPARNLTIISPGTARAGRTLSRRCTTASGAAASSACARAGAAWKSKQEPNAAADAPARTLALDRRLVVTTMALAPQFFGSTRLSWPGCSHSHAARTEKDTPYWIGIQIKFSRNTCLQLNALCKSTDGNVKCLALTRIFAQF